MLTYVPALVFGLALLRGAEGLAAAAGLLAALAGILVERWLLFAEATHTAALYYRG